MNNYLCLEWNEINRHMYQCNRPQGHDGLHKHTQSTTKVCCEWEINHRNNLKRMNILECKIKELENKKLDLMFETIHNKQKKLQLMFEAIRDALLERSDNLTEIEEAVKKAFPINIKKE